MRKATHLHRSRRALRAVRLLSLLLALLSTLGGQLRSQPAVPLAAVEARVVAKQPQSLEQHALCTGGILRLGPAPRLARLPVFWPVHTCLREPNTRLLVERALGVARAQVATHFHAKRRIPRMNSEEPPRA